MCRLEGPNAGMLTAKSLVEAAARDVQAKGRLQPWSSKGWRLGLVEAAAKKLEDACQEKVYAMWFDLGKVRRKSSTPAVVPGAAPALAKAGVGGFHFLCVSNVSQHFLMSQISVKSVSNQCQITILHHTWAYPRLLLVATCLWVKILCFKS